MGWSFGFDTSRKLLVDSILNHQPVDNSKYHTKALKHIIRQEKGYDVLWVVAEVTLKVDTEFYGTRKAGDKVRLIDCFLLAAETPNGYWGYSSTSEPCGPIYYSCPLSYLALADTGINKAWREQVRHCHTQRKQQRAN